MNNSTALNLVCVLSIAATACVGEAVSEEDEDFKAVTTTDALSLSAPCEGILSADHPIANVLPVQILDDSAVIAGGGYAAVKAVGSGTHFLPGPKHTCVGVFDALLTSDPSSGGALQSDAIGAAPEFASNTEVEVKIDTNALASGTYWLRFITQLADGSWEAAEGVLMVH